MKNWLKDTNSRKIKTQGRREWTWLTDHSSLIRQSLSRWLCRWPSWTIQGQSILRNDFSFWWCWNRWHSSQLDLGHCALAANSHYCGVHGNPYDTSIACWDSDYEKVDFGTGRGYIWVTKLEFKSLKRRSVSGSGNRVETLSLLAGQALWY